MSSGNDENSKTADTGPVPLKEKLGCLIVIAFIVAFIALIVWIVTLPREIQYYEVTVGGLNFHVLEGYELSDSGEDDLSAYQKYEKEPPLNDENNTPTYYLEFFVFESMTIDQVVSDLAFDDGWKLEGDTTYGEYTGVRADIIVLPFRNTVPQWFVFEKGGKTVAVYFQGDFEKCIVKIINGN